MGSSALSTFLDSARETSSLCVVEGPPGIGKSHLIEEVLDGAHGWRILKARPAEAERRLVGSALFDLCDAVTDDELASLPSALGPVLAVSLLRASADNETAPLAVAAAFTALIRRLAQRSPVLICVDDIQWLDAETAQVLAFAAHRLPEAGVAILAGLRTGPRLAEPDVVAELRTQLPHRQVTVEPMPTDTLATVIRGHFGSTVEQAVVTKAAEVAAGNPMFGIEVARSLRARSDVYIPERVTLPTSLTQVVGQHIRELPTPTQQLLAAAAAIRKPLIEELRELGVSDSLADAEASGLIRIDDDEVSFTHPLYAAAAYDALTGLQRMNLHARLARVVIGEEERARHMALGADGPDEEVALALDGARDRALSRGALHAATDACQLGLGATPDGSANRPDRLIEYGRLLYQIGDTPLACEQLRSAAESTDDNTFRARALYQLSKILGDTESAFEGARVALEALPLAGDDLELLVDIHRGLALIYAFDWQVALEHARIAIRLTDDLPAPNPRKVAAALGAYVMASFYAGDGADIETCMRVIELQAGSVDLELSERAVSQLAFLYMWTDDFANARLQFDYVYQLSIDEGDEASRGYLLALMALMEFKAGNWRIAEEYIQECRDLFARSGNRYATWVVDQQQLWIDVFRGQYDEAISVAAVDIENGQASDNYFVELRGRSLRGFCLLAQGNAVAAAEDLDRYRTLFDSNNAGEPALRQYAAEHIEALVLAGRLEDAQFALDDLASTATRLGRTAVLAAAARSEALLHAALGDGDAAVDAASRSLALYDQVERRFDRARTLYTRGSIHRRFKRKSLALKDLNAALDDFVDIGSESFAAKAREEINRVGVRRADPSPGLTETERQIAELTARGMTANDVAARLFLSPRTVSANLTVIYRKLGVRNRAELIARVNGEGLTPSDVAPTG